jgi:DNA-binding Lrp family transcriptional regulator
MTTRADLDTIDWKILSELQAHGRMTIVELSRRIGITASHCLRRIKHLENTGVIRGYRALLNGPVGMDMVAFCMVGLQHHSEAGLRAVADQTREWEIVRDAWMLDEVSNFPLHCLPQTLAPLQNFVLKELASTPNVNTVRTSLTIRQVKEEGPESI